MMAVRFSSRVVLFDRLHPHVLSSGGTNGFEMLLPGFKDHLASEGAVMLGHTEPCSESTLKLVSLTFFSLVLLSSRWRAQICLAT